MINSLYIKWLKKEGVPLFEGGGVYWRLYQGALIPALESYNSIELSKDEANSLLRQSRAWFLRYSSDLCEEETEWWYLICDRYDPQTISSKTRETINRGNRKCSVREIDAGWLAKNGYECYRAAFKRYRNVKPISEEVFHNNILTTVGGPFEYFGIFVKDSLAGYSQCIIEGNNAVKFSISKYHPDYLRYQISYAHVNSLIQHYVVDHSMSLYSGMRSIAHDTNYQDLLLKLGHRRQFCRLSVVYQPWLKFSLQVLFPFRKFIAQLPDRDAIHKLQVLLSQEELRRACSVR